jgi:hypothetical protein
MFYLVISIIYKTKGELYMDEIDRRVEKHMELCKELNNTYDCKNRDYGNSFGDTFQKLGIISAITRITDKYNRLVSLCTKPENERKVKDESIRDTLMDMANYCMMTVIELEKEKE